MRRVAWLMRRTNRGRLATQWRDDAMLPPSYRSVLLSSVQLLSLRHRAWSVALIGALGVASLQGSETTALVIEYRGPSNESIAPIVLAQRSRTCADVQRIMAARQIRLGPSQCPVDVTSGELAALARSLKELRADTAGPGLLQPELLRATIFETDSVVTEVRIPRERAEQALDAVERHAPGDRYPALGARVREMRQRVKSSAESQPEGLIPLSTPYCGTNASGIDETIQSRIVYDLTRIPPTWSVQTDVSSNSRANRLIRLDSPERRVFVGIAYLASSQDAARALQCRLNTIAMPRFRFVTGIGDEAYVLSTAHLMFRTGTLVFHVMSSDMSFDAEQVIATRLIASTRPR